MIKTPENIYDFKELSPLFLQGWHGDSNLFHKLIDENNPTIIIEIGTWLGLSAINMASYCKQKGYNTKVYCVDTWLGNYEWHTSDDPQVNMRLRNGYPQVYYQFLSNVIHSGVQDIITPFPNTSSIMSKYFKQHDVKSELIYIDASHEYFDVLRDLECYYELLSENGVIFGDDYQWGGVREAVNAFASQIGREVHVFDNNFWTLRK